MSPLSQQRKTDEILDPATCPDWDDLDESDISDIDDDVSVCDDTDSQEPNCQSIDCSMLNVALDDLVTVFGQEFLDIDSSE